MKTGFLLQWIILRETKYNDGFVSWLIDYVDRIDDIRSICSILEDVGQIRNATDLNFVGYILFQPKIMLCISHVMYASVRINDVTIVNHREFSKAKMSPYIFPPH